jgi:hypothetical protein
MVLTLLAFALPTAVSAKSVGFDTGNFVSGSMTGTFNTSIDLTEVGSLAKITIHTGTLFKMSTCAQGLTCYAFKGGSVTVDQGGTMVFSDSLKGGITVKEDGSATISGFLMPNSIVGHGAVVAELEFKGNKILGGSGDLGFEPRVVPEPSSLLSLGTGLIGLAGMMRRKLRI